MLFLTPERVEIDEATLTAADLQMMLIHYPPRRGPIEDDMLETLRRRLADEARQDLVTHREGDKVELGND